MNRNRTFVRPVIVAIAIPALFATLSAFAATETKPATPSAAERMQQSGAEEQQLKRRTGTWAVKATFRPTPDAAPVVTEQLVAERTMVGLYMEEVMHPDAGAKMPGFRRVAYQYYSRVEGRWQYVSTDTRFPVGIMPAYSFANESDGRLTLHFESLADGTARQWLAVEYEYTRRR